MALTLDGTTGVSAVQAGAVESGDLPAGSTLQVVQETTGTAVVTTSSSYVSTGLSASITPLSINSQVLVIIHQPMTVKRESAYVNMLGYRVVNTTSSATVFENQTGLVGAYFPTSGNNQIIWPVSISFVDSPNATSSVTYEVQFKCRTSSDSGEVEANSSQGGTTSIITLMEIAG